ncbi:12-oxophytodienoate reductase [Rhodococcus sp. 14C212]|uniref:oxidoreductase n=1 Tax=Rhodococcus sp. 14C212 TaxID=2711209 RepID=UPI003211E503
MSRNDRIDLTPFQEPFRWGGLSLRNRFALAPMTRLKSPGGVPTADNADYYRRRAAAGVGLIITEGVHVRDPAAGFSLDVPHAYGADAAAGWRAVIAQVHAEGSAIIPQLWHMGAMRGGEYDRGPDTETVSPSGIGLDGRPVGRALTGADIERIIGDFVESATFAKECGFDGAEIHGAHGYIIDEFLWQRTNRRGDVYGYGNRHGTKFAVDLIRAIRGAVGPDFPIVFRFSQWKSDHYRARLASSPQELEEILTPLVDAGVDLFHPSSRRHWMPEFESHGDLGLAGWTKKITGCPTIAVGSVGVGALMGSDNTIVAETVQERLTYLLQQFEHDEFDIVAIGRALLADAQWVQKATAGAWDEIKPYVRPPRGERLY